MNDADWMFAPSGYVPRDTGADPDTIQLPNIGQQPTIQPPPMPAGYGYPELEGVLRTALIYRLIRDYLDGR